MKAKELLCEILEALPTGTTLRVSKEVISALVKRGAKKMATTQDLVVRFHGCRFVCATAKKDARVGRHKPNVSISPVSVPAKRLGLNRYVMRLF